MKRRAEQETCTLDFIFRLFHPENHWRWRNGGKRYLLKGDGNKRETYMLHTIYSWLRNLLCLRWGYIWTALHATGSSPYQIAQEISDLRLSHRFFTATICNLRIFCPRPGETMTTPHDLDRKHFTANTAYVSKSYIEPYKLNRIFTVMINHRGQVKALVVAYDETFASLRTDIGKLFRVQGLPNLRELWADQTRWNCMDHLNDDNTDAMLRPIWARGSKNANGTCWDELWPWRSRNVFEDGGKWFMWKDEANCSKFWRFGGEYSNGESV